MSEIGQQQTLEQTPKIALRPVIQAIVRMCR